MEKHKCDLCKFKSPNLIYLSCHHKSCTDCFYKICLFNKERCTFYCDKEVELILECPLCENGTLEISKQEILDKLNENCAIKIEETWETCTAHNKEIKIFCSQCKTLMCQDCFNNHKIISIFSTHEQGDQKQQKNSLIQNLCSTHPNRPIQNYCKDCNLLLCDKCKSGKHDSHKLTNISKFLLEKKDEIKSQLVLKSFDEISKDLDESDVKLHDQIKTRLKNLKDKIRIIIESLTNTCNGLDTKLELLQQDFKINNSIMKIIFMRLKEDLDNLSNSTEFNYEYYSSIPTGDFFTCLEESIIKDKSKKILEDLTKTEYFSDVDGENFTSEEPVINILNIKEIIINIKTLTGHSNGVYNLIQLYDGRIASASSDKSIRIWDPQDDFNCSHTLTGHTFRVWSLIQLSDMRLASSSRDNTIRIWDTNNNFKNTHILRGHADEILCLCKLNDGRIISGSKDKTMKVWNPQDNFKCTLTLIGHSHSIWCVIHLKDGRICSGSGDKTIKIWDVQADFKCTLTILEHTSIIYNIIQLKNGNIASCSSDKTIKIFNAKQEFKLIHTLSEESSVFCLTELENNMIACGSENNCIKVWDPNDNFRCVSNLKGHHGPVFSLIQISDGRLISGSGDNTIKIWC